MLLLDMRVSIIMPVLNEAENIELSLQALQSYRQQGHELIVIDGNSQDNTVELASNLCDKLISSSVGRARQMNAGAEQASGNILLFLHADTHLPDNAMHHITNSIMKKNKVWGRFDVKLSGSHALLRLVAIMINLRSRLTGIATGDQCMFVRRDIFHKIKGFTEIPLMEDISLSRALLAQSSPVCLPTKVMTSSRRWEQKGIVYTILLMWYLRLAYFLGKPPEVLAQIYSR